MLILKEVEGYSIEEIAEVLELNSNTVKVRLFARDGGWYCWQRTWGLSGKEAACGTC